MISSPHALNRSEGLKTLLFFNLLFSILFLANVAASSSSSGGSAANGVSEENKNNIETVTLSPSWSKDLALENDDEIRGFDDFELDNFDADESFESNVHGIAFFPTDEVTSAAETINVENNRKKFDDLGGVLGHSVGVAVRRAGGYGSYSTVQIRGANSSQVAIYLDGILLNSGGNASVDLSDYNLDSFASMEVYRGSTPVALGLGSIGGSVSLKTKMAQESVTELGGSYGSWNSYRLFALHSSMANGFNVLSIIGFHGSSGNFVYLNRNGTLLNADDDQLEERTNNGHNAASSLLKLSREINKWKLTLLNDLFVENQGVPAIESVPGATASLLTFRNLVALQAKHHVSSIHSLDFSASYLFGKTRFDDRKNEIGVGQQSSVYRTHTVRGHIVWDIAATTAHQGTVRVEGGVDSFGTRDLLTRKDKEPGVQKKMAVGIEYRWRPVHALKLVPSLRWLTEHSTCELEQTIGQLNGQTLRKDDHYWLPSVGVRWALNSRVTFRGNLGRYVRTPDLYEMYGDRGTISGNVDLVAEDGLNADLGMTYQYSGPAFVNKALLYWGVFGSWSDNLIAYVQNSQNTIRAENVDSAKSTGLEFNATFLFADFVSLDANYTLLNAVNLSDKPYHNGKQLPGRPTHSAYVKLSLEKKWRRWLGSVWSDVDYNADTYLDHANINEEVLGHALLGAGGQLEYIPKQLTVSLEVKNLLDQIVLTDDEGKARPLQNFAAYPLPGRSFYITINWKV